MRFSINEFRSDMDNVLYLLVFIMFVGCGCSDKFEEHPPPVFKSSIPENGAIDVIVETVIEVVFDEVVNLSSPHNITINGRAADVSASFTKLIFNEILEEKTIYNVVVPKEAVLNTFGIALEKEVRFSFTTESNEVIIAENLVVPNSSPQATNVYNFLKNNYGKNIVSASVANSAWNLNEAEWVKYHTGKYPAMACMDYIFLAWSPANWIDYNKIDFIKDWWENNGLVAASWHWNVPHNPEETDVSKFTYKNETSFKPSNVPIEGTWENQVAKADFDKLIAYIKLLQDENIPLIWRPLHEAAGNIYVYNNGKAWFWWGSDGGDAYVELWRFMFNYFKEKGVNNLIWVWTTQTNDDDFYPGDEYVDMIGRDIYNNSDSDDIVFQFKAIQKKYPNKMVSLSECGSVSEIPEQWSKGAKWSFFMPWTDHDRTGNIGDNNFKEQDHKYANISWWNKALEQNYVITRDELPSLK